jgi:uncharacterized protein YebE (UPF0316 family)
LAINQIWSDFSNPLLLLAYAAGFATGNYVGIYLDEKISIGNSMIRIIVIKNSKKLVNELKKNGYQLTVIDGHSADQNTEVKMILVVVKRKELKNVLKILKKINPNSFFTIEDIRNVRKNRNELLKEKRNSRRLFK